MRYLFIINPTAGKHNPQKTYGHLIEEICKRHRLNYSVVLTEYPGHAAEIAKKEAKKGGVKIFVCGGDGTLSEASNGIIGYNNDVHLGCIPCGSGNDYVKSFPGADFLNIEKNILGTPKQVDVIKCNDMYSLNICSVGIDAEVGKGMTRFKRVPLVSGKAAYTLSLICVLIGKIFKRYRIEIDSESFEGDFLLALAASGECYGGGYWGAKGAVVDDGLLDFVIIKKISLLKISSLLATYKKGQHINNPEFDDIMFFRRGKKMKIQCKDGAVLNVDGECSKINCADLEIIPKAISFIVPKQ